MKKFTPKLAALSKKQIHSFFYSKERNVVGKPWFEYATSDDVARPAFMPNQMPDRICQQFVDAEYSFTDDFDHEEDRVDARNELIDIFHPLFVKAAKRGKK